jgi:G:T-mismatch repair DNA endonuclease (very short patch repair protein)
MLIEHKHRKEIRKKRSENIRGENHPMFGKHHKLESIQKNKDSNKKKFDSPDYLRKYQMAHSVKPTGPEISIRDLLDTVAPGKYEYVGNFTKWIGGRNPDFISEEDKKVIEVFGDHWHSEKITGRSKVEEEKDRIEGFKKVGFRTLIIWERELNNMNHIAEKIKEFELL